MAVSNNNIEFGSPNKEVSWVTPDNDFNKICFPSKRKCNSDSGYVSSGISPASGCRTLNRDRMLMTPDISNSDRFVVRAESSLYTPSVKAKTECLKKRLLQISQDGHSSSFFNTMTVEDSFSDFMEASLYTEPMDISMIESNQLCTPNSMDLIAEENVDIREISKKITVDLSVEEINSMCSEPISPFTSKSMAPIDRLYQSSVSLKSSFSSPRKKRCQVKKKSKKRSLVGCEKVDFLYQLGEKANFSLAVNKILDYLSDSDLGNVTMVSKTWKRICLSQPKANERWKKFVADRKERKENLHCIEGKQKRAMTPLLCRNHSTPLQMRQPSSPPVSPSKYRFHLFQKEASKLKEDEKLMACPRCSLPSTVSPVTRLGRCSRVGCALEFCSTCKSPYHGPTPCTTSTPNSPQRPKRIGSKESKRFLRRL